MTPALRNLALTAHVTTSVGSLGAVAVTILLFVHMQPVSEVARVAAATTLSAVDLRNLRVQLVADAGAALFALLIATALSVYKPRGTRPVAYASATLAALLFLTVVVMHLAGRGLGGH